MSTGDDLKKLFAAATPLIEQGIALTEKMAGLRKAATKRELDWGQIKALAKATILDGQDNRKRVKAIIDKADAACAYADMLGLSGGNRKNNFIKPQNLNEKNEGRRDATGPKHAAPPETTGTVSDDSDALAINHPPAPSQDSDAAAETATPSVSAAPIPESEPVALQAPIHCGGAGPDRETGLHAGSPPIRESDEFNDIRGSFLDRSLRV